MIPTSGKRGVRVEPDERTLLGGRYRLGAVLGRGGVATVHAAIDVVLGREVAVKVFRSAGGGLDRYRFATEARLLAGLSHPGLVTVHDVCLDGDQPYLVMRLVRGSTLRPLLDAGPLGRERTARIGARIAEALAYVHERDIVHRDVKPSNILLGASGTCHLADFGIARALGSAHLTMTGELVGTVAYLAPEQITDIDVGPRADVYSLGLVLLECLTGRVEYDGTTAEAAVARLSRSPRVPDELPSSWRSLLSAMTARDPADRPDAAECGRRLDAIARGSAETDRVPRVAPAGLRPVHAGLSAVAVAAALVFGVFAGPATVVPGTPTGGAEVPAGTAPAAGPTDRAPAATTTRIPVAPAANPSPVAPEPAAPAPAPRGDTGGGPNANAVDQATTAAAAGPGSGKGKGKSKAKEKGKGKGKGANP